MFKELIAAITIIEECDSFSITENDKSLIINVFGTIIKSLREMGLVTTEISAQYAVLKVATWNNAYFCIVARKLCSLVLPALNLCEECF